jgi:purine-binding chemotaxis protein CheW
MLRSVRRPKLSPAQVPMVQDPEPARQHDVDETDNRGSAELVAPVPVMLIRCGRIPLAIDAMAVHATLSDPRVEPSLLATGHCRGVIPYGGSFVPALDLLSWSGLGELAEDAWRQAFVVRLDAGMVAFLVEAVVDIVPIQPQQVIALPRFALPRPELFAGALSRQALPGHDIEHDRRHAAQYLVLASDALCTDPQVVVRCRVSPRTPTALLSLRHGDTDRAGARNLPYRAEQTFRHPPRYAAWRCSATVRWPF